MTCIFAGKPLQNKAFSNRNKGHLGSRNILLNIYIYVVEYIYILLHLYKYILLSIDIYCYIYIKYKYILLINWFNCYIYIYATAPQESTLLSYKL